MTAPQPPLIPTTADGEESLHAPVRRANRARSVMTLNLVSMIDIVFLLQMYFLLTTNFAVREAIYLLDLPPSLRPAQIDPYDLPDLPLVITVESLGPAPDDYRIRLDIPGADDIADAPALERFLVAQRYSDANPGGIFLPDNPVHIRPDGSALWEHTIEVFNAAVRAQYENVQLVEPRR